jgi:hypothetical protein
VKYRAVSTECAEPGCGELRFGRHKVCRVHLSERERERRKLSGKSGPEILDRASQHLAQQCWPNMPAADFKANADARALLIGKQIEAFNNQWKPEREREEAKAA